MSTAASPPTASPLVTRTPSSSNRQQAYNNPVDRDRPHRTQSTATRSAAPPSPRRSLSQTQTSSQSRAASSSQQTNLVNVARRDFEQTNLARPASSRRSEDRDRSNGAPLPTRADSTRSHQGTSSRSRPSRLSTDGPAPPQVSAINGASTANGSRPIPVSSGSARRRTTIDATTGQWHLGKTIGAGSMGKVKLARNQETGEQVAVKIVPRQSTDEHRNSADRERADHSKEVRTAREAAIVMLVDHPYICGMRDVVRTNYHWYMLFEYVNGGQMLDYIISHGRLKEKQARKFGRQIASALDYCHRNSIVHRDLKIENILISKTGDIKIIDFGLSNLFSPRSYLKTFCGSLYFAAPELLQAKQYTGPEVDVWSFGIVLYVLVCGKVPFDDQSMPQLHAKIKKGIVEYPPWLSTECKGLISRMLVTDPAQRAGLAEIMNHPWMTKGYNTSPDNYLPPRQPLQLPLDTQVIDKMTGFDFGSATYITEQLTKVVQSDDFQRAVRLYNRKNTAHIPEFERKRGVFDFYKRRNSVSSRDTLTNSSSEAVQLGVDPVNAFSPLVSVYYLVREKQERERKETNPGALSMPMSPGEKPLKMPDLPAPEAAYTNPATYETAGEKPTGGRSRPRARTHGEDEVADALQNMNLKSPGPPSPAIIVPPTEQTPVKKEGATFGLLRRLSTRRYKEPDRERHSNALAPSVAVSSPTEPVGVPRKSFSIRRNRDRDRTPSTTVRSASSQAQQTELLAPPPASENTSKLKSLGRSASVNSSDLRRRFTRRGVSEGSTAQPQPTSGSEQSSIIDQKVRPGDAASDAEQPSNRPRAPVQASRAKSLGHARRESIQARRARREQTRESNVPEETDQDLADAESRPQDGGSPGGMKPVFLKGLFSVSTTSTKPLSVIRADLIRVLKQLNVDFREIRGGFSCRYVPSIDPNKADNDRRSPRPRDAVSGAHKRKVSFGGLMGGDRDRDEVREQQQQRTPQTPRSRKPAPDRSFTNSEESDDSIGQRGDRDRATRAAGETTTHVQSDYGENMVLKFEIFVVKVPLLSLHGIQFKKVDGGTWQYKNMATAILNELRL